MQDCYIRTDLASEGRIATPAAANELSGVRYQESSRHGCAVAVTEITSEEGARALGKPQGHYTMIETGRLWCAEEEQITRCVRCLSEEISAYADRLAPRAHSIFVCGMGNRAITPDAIGPLCIDKIPVTRHVEKSDPALFSALGGVALSALAPGVAGQTGVETHDLILGAAEQIRPDLVVAVDALACRSAARLATSVQLTDAGIAPGSGIGNRRKEISARTLGIPTLIIGVPTVVDSSTLIYDTLEQAGMAELSDALRELLDNSTNFFVSLKETDLAVEAMSDLIARAIAAAFLPENAR